MRDDERPFATQSVQEAMTDPRQHKVGAVLVKDGVALESAHGGQVERGVHAEATLLDLCRKPVQGATLYVTLEPCGKSVHWTSLKYPRSCAEIIADRGIARVVIGMRDPDPRIYGRGLRILKKEGVEIDWFPADLRERCEQLNSSWANERRKEWKYGKPFFEALELHRGSRIFGSSREVCVGDIQTLRICSDIKEGWPLISTEVLFGSELRDEMVEVPDKWRQLYEKYRKVLWHKKKFMDDRDKIMLTQPPWTTTDTTTLLLSVKRTKYSHIQFYKDVVSADTIRQKQLLTEIETLSSAPPADRSELVAGIRERRQEFEAETKSLIEEAVDGVSGPGGSVRRSIRFPHAFCLHVIVVTRDAQILLTRRAPETEYRPTSWSCSFEEHMAAEDISPTSKDTIPKWVGRALREELGLIGGEDYDAADIRILSVFLETDILNVSLCCFVRLKRSSEELRDEFRCMPVPDSAETAAFDFLAYEDNKLIQDVLWPRPYYHPTSQYRLLMALMKKNGWPFGD